MRDKGEEIVQPTEQCTLLPLTDRQKDVPAKGKAYKQGTIQNEGTVLHKSNT